MLRSLHDLPYTTNYLIAEIFSSIVRRGTLPAITLLTNDVSQVRTVDEARNILADSRMTSTPPTPSRYAPEPDAFGTGHYHANSLVGNQNKTRESTPSTERYMGIPSYSEPPLNNFDDSRYKHGSHHQTSKAFQVPAQSSRLYR